MNQKSITIIGAGLSGICAAIQLQKAGIPVTLIERKTFPFHRVCGEYISNETLPFLEQLGVPMIDLKVSKISKLQISSPSGNLLTCNLDLGGFGISRYKLDYSLIKMALALGVTLINAKVSDVNFLPEKDEFCISLADKNQHYSKFVIGSFGKRSNIDQQLNRPFFRKRSPYVGVKYHIKTNFPIDTIQLDNFEGGYCGLSKIEDDLYCLCYLSHRNYLKKYKSILEFEKNILYKNPFLKKIFTDSEFVFSKPEVINEITFEKKNLIQNHLLFCGDAAGMITPLCGNGMAMAIHSSKILSEILIKEIKSSNTINRNKIEKEYKIKWNKEFAKRLKWGRIIQTFFGNRFITELAIKLIKLSPALQQKLISLTHGNPF